MNDSLVAIVIDDLLVWNFCVIKYAQQCTLKNGTKIKKKKNKVCASSGEPKQIKKNHFESAQQ